MKNIVQSHKFMASNLVPDKIPDDLLKEVNDVLALTRKADKTEEEQAVVDAKQAALIEKCPPAFVKQINKIGAKYPTDVVEVYMSLGDFFFDLYSVAAPRPESPLGKRSAAKKLQDLSEALFKDDFEVPDYAVEPIKRALGTDSIWAKMNVTVYVKVGEAKEYFTITARGANLYHEILNAATQAFEDSL